MRAWKNLTLAAVLLLLAACGSEPTAVHARPEAKIEARRSTSGRLTVSVYGPTQVEPGECAFWYSSVSGGTPPYQYAWSGLTTSDNTGDSVYGYIHGGGVPIYNFISVSVTDALGRTGWAERVVYLPPNDLNTGCW